MKRKMQDYEKKKKKRKRKINEKNDGPKVYIVEALQQIIKWKNTLNLYIKISPK